MLEGILPTHLYNLLNLLIAITILLFKSLTSDLLFEAIDLLHLFVRRSTSDKLYGSSFMVYNVHTLLHIADEGNAYGSLNYCSAFPFENYLSFVKRLVRDGKAPLKQIANRLEERDYTRKVKVKTSDTISCNLPSNLYIDANNVKCAKLI